MTTADQQRLREIRSFPSLIKYLREELDWPINTDDFDELTFEYEPEELGIDPKTAAKIETIKQLRPLDSQQPWGIFFVKFEPKRLPVVALRRILGSLAIRKRTSAKRSEQAAWKKNDLLFVSSYGEGDNRHITFAHFTENIQMGDLPVLRVMGWDGADTPLHIDHVHQTLTEKLRWPEDTSDVNAWRESWSSAFTLRHREVIDTSKKLAIRLADLARDIRLRVNSVLEMETENGHTRKLMSAFREALIHDLNEDDFADMYAQTIAYGLLTARVSRPAALVADNITDMVPITNPFLKELMETFLHISGRRNGKGSNIGIDFDELGINDVVETLRDANMEAVMRDFGDKNPQEDPVIHFYELFLKEYDAKKRMQRGVFYTPKPVVSFIVRSVDKLLRTEFGLEDGLADTTTWGEMTKRFDELKIPDGATPDQAFVQILDPATGTGTFLVEVIGLIHKTMTVKWEKEGHLPLTDIPQLWNEYVPKHLLPRLHGYELMMAPYAIAHMKIGLKLYETGYRFESDERVRVYLTNSLEPVQDFSGKLAFAIPALAHEAEAVNAIKRDQRFTVVIGNPPYFGEAGRGGEWIADLMRGIDNQTNTPTHDYFQVDGKPLGERNPKWLNDDYVKFIRLSEWHIERTGLGVFSFITNHSYLDNPTFRGMRQSLMTTFSKMQLYDLHGSTKKMEKAPDGGKDDNVFDIEQGVAINVSFKKYLKGNADVYHADLYGLRDDKYRLLMGQDCHSVRWIRLHPQPTFHLLLPEDVGLRSEYESGVRITDIMPVNSVCIATARDALTIQGSPKKVAQVVGDFVNLPVEEARKQYGLGKDTKDWKVALAQDDLRRSGPSEKRIVPILYRVFDKRYTYFTGRSRGYICRPRRETMSHMISGENIGLITNRHVMDGEIRHTWVASELVDLHVIQTAHASAYLFPLYIYPKSSDGMFEDTSEWVGKNGRTPNLERPVVEMFETALDMCFVPDGHGDLEGTFGPQDVLHYIYSVLLGPTYRKRYAGFLKMDFPRVFLTENLRLFRTLARLGSELVILHLMKSPKLDNQFTTLVGSSELQIEKVSHSDETVWIDKAKTRGFRGVPEEVWNFHIGGYQVCQKWLKDRGPKKGNPGRVLTAEDIDHYQKIVVALSETIRIMKEIDEVIDAHGGWPDAFIINK